MMAARVEGRLTEIDWSVPWLAAYRETGLAVIGAMTGGATVAQALNQVLEGGMDRPRLAAGRLQFIAQAGLPPGQPYESFIARTACVPTRDNLHDLFNGLVWLRWPKLKRHLNELQATELARLGVATTRGAVRDALTLFDENAALLQLPPRLEADLRQRDWRALFVEHRAAWADAGVWLVGHALLEKLVHPRKAITAHAWLLPPHLPAHSVETWLCEELTPRQLAARHRLALPVLGLPGWWAANEVADFYADSAVFRGQHRSDAAAIIDR